jgi:RNA polymerase sigma-70 factor (ECF subfamily)
LTNSENYTADEILGRVSNGDEDAFRKLFHLYKEKIYTVAFKLTKSEISAEELLQDVFLIIWLRKERLSEVQDFESYLFIVTRNQAYKTIKALAAQKKKSREAQSGLPIFHRETEETISLKEANAILRKAIEKLPSQQRQVYTLIKEQGYTREQTAQELQIHPETVKTHLAKALKSIRAFCMANFDVLIVLLLSFIELLR